MDSHIFPAWMGKHIRGEGPLLSVPTNAESDPGFIFRHGIYDQIVCDSCEKSFGPADKYFAEFNQQRANVQIITKGATRAHIYSGWNQALIQRFFLACLFRAHLCKRGPFARFDLGPYAEKLRHILLGPVLGVDRDFDTLLLRETHVVAESMVAPVRVRMEAVNVARMSVPGFTAIVRIDQRPFPKFGRSFLLGVNSEICMAEMDEVHPDLMSGLVEAERIHGERLDRMVDSQMNKKTGPV